MHLLQMIRPKAGRRGAVAAVSALWLAGVPNVSGQTGTQDPEFAQVMPLAIESLLLDITRNAAGDLVAVGERGHILRREDGEWIQSGNVPTRATLTSVASAAGRLWAAGHDTVVLRSDDGGRTWVRQYHDPERQQPILDLYFMDAERGFAIGAYGLMLVTRDGGEHWEDHGVSDEEWHLNGILDLGGGRMVIAGEAGLAYLSEDHGETWEVIELPYPGSMWGVSEAADGCVLVFGLRGHVQESCDAGETWTELASGTEASLGGGDRHGDLTVLAGNSGVILKRRSGGAFEVHHHSSGVDFSSVLALGDGRFVLVGEDGVHYYPEAAVEAGS